MSEDILSRIAGWCGPETDLEIEGGTITIAGEPPIEVQASADDEVLALTHTHTVHQPPSGFAERAAEHLSERGSMVTGEVVSGGGATSVRLRYPIYLEGLNRQSFVVAVREITRTVDGLRRIEAGGRSGAAAAEAAGAARQGAPPPTEPERKPARPAPAAAAPAPWAATHRVPPTGMSAWKEPDPSQAPAVMLSPGVQLRVDEQRGAWARVTGSNGWTGWVDARILVPGGAATPAATAARPAASRVAGAGAGAIHPTALLGGVLMIVGTFLKWGFGNALDVPISSAWPIYEWVQWTQPRIGMILLAAGALVLVTAFVPQVHAGLRFLAGAVGALLSAGVVATIGINFGWDQIGTMDLLGAYVAIGGGLVAMLPSQRTG